MENNETTSCYSYKVEMIIQILAKDEKTAREQLDRSGGYTSSRKVNLMDAVELYAELEKDKP